MNTHMHVTSGTVRMAVRIHCTSKGLAVSVYLPSVEESAHAHRNIMTHSGLFRISAFSGWIFHTSCSSMCLCYAATVYVRWDAGHQCNY